MKVDHLNQPYIPVLPPWYQPPATPANAAQPGQPVYQALPPAMAYQPPGIPANTPPMPLPAQPSTAQTLLGSSFVKGALIGGIAAYVLTNETVQQAAIRASVKAWAMLQGGVEEMKERFRDAEAELHAADLDEE